MTDNQEYCCAAGVCCDRPKQEAALINLFMSHAHLSAEDAGRAAHVILNSFDLLPKAAGLSEVVKYIQAHPYK